MRTWKIGLGKAGWDTKWYTITAWTLNEALDKLFRTLPRGGHTGTVYYEEIT